MSARTFFISSFRMLTEFLVLMASSSRFFIADRTGIIISCTIYFTSVSLTNSPYFYDMLRVLVAKAPSNFESFGRTVLDLLDGDTASFTFAVTAYLGFVLSFFYSLSFSASTSRFIALCAGNELSICSIIISIGVVTSCDGVTIESIYSTDVIVDI